MLLENRHNGNICMQLSRVSRETLQWLYMCAIVTSFQRIVTMATHIYLQLSRPFRESSQSHYICAIVTCFQESSQWQYIFYVQLSHPFRESSQWQYICITVTCFQRIVTMAIYLYNCHVLSENRHNGRPWSSDSWTCSWSLLRLPLHAPC